MLGVVTCTLALLGSAPALPAAARNTCREIDLAIDTDAEFVLQHFEGDVFAARRAILDLVATASGITRASLDVRLRVSFLRVRQGSPRRDPWNAVLVADQWTEFRDWWAANESATPCDIAILLCGRELDGSLASPASVCTPNGVIVLSNLTGSVPDTPVSFDEANNDLLLLVRSVAMACGAAETAECTPGDGCAASQPPHGSIMSACALCPGGAANIDLAFLSESIEAVWSHLEAIDCPLGTSESGVLPTDDLVYVTAGTHALLDVVANDNMTNCGPITLVSADRSTKAGTPVSLVTDEEGVTRLLVAPSPTARGIDRCSYVASDPDEASGVGHVELFVRSADFDGDGRVDATDLAILIGDWGSTALTYDLDGNGSVGGSDLAQLLEAWTSAWTSA